MPPRTRTQTGTGPSPDTPGNSSSPPAPVDKIVSPAVAQSRADAALPTVQQLMIEVMRRVTHVGKDQRNREQKFSFRGIDDVINALGPALREVGVLCVPTVEWSERQMTKTVKGNNTRETIARVRYTFYGPRGDSISAVTEGESLDSGDKGTAKVFSVAFRIALIQVFALPTDEPDPDSFSYERGDDRDDDTRECGGRWEGRPSMRDHFGTDDEREQGRQRRERTHPDRVSAQDGDEADDLIDTADPEQLRNQMLLTLKDKLRYYKIEKGRAADTFADIFGEELPTADPDLIERYIALIVQLGFLPEIEPDTAEQHPAVAKLMAVRNQSDAAQDPRAADQAAIDRDNIEHR